METLEGSRSKEEFVHSVFTAIARRYDLMNTIISFNMHKRWRAFAVVQTGLRPGGRGLDVCCGTGAFAVEQSKMVKGSGTVIGLDFCEEMLAIAQENIRNSPYRENIEFVQGNAMEMPFPDDHFDCATIGFALRNVPDIEGCLKEMSRVVKPGGAVVSLELAKPSAQGWKQLFHIYFDWIMPLLGKLAVGRRGPYDWLSYSAKIFPHQRIISELFHRVGLVNVRCHELTGGVVAVHVGLKPAVHQ